MEFFQLHFAAKQFVSSHRVHRFPTNCTTTYRMAAKRSRSRRRSRPAAEKNELRDNEDDREVWPVLIILIRVMIASWFIYSACDRFLRPGAWDKYIGYQREYVPSTCHLLF